MAEARFVERSFLACLTGLRVWQRRAAASPFAGHSKGVMAMERIFASIQETGSTLGLGRSTIYRMINDGQLEKVKLGSRTLIRISSIQALANSEAGAPHP